MSPDYTVTHCRPELLDGLIEGDPLDPDFNEAQYLGQITAANTSLVEYPAPEADP